MKNQYKEGNFKRTVFTVNDNLEIVEHVLGELCRAYADYASTPHGMAPRYHTRGRELWTWGAGGNAPELVSECKNKAEAEHWLLLFFKSNLQNACDGPAVFDTREEAEEWLREYLEEELNE